MTGTPPTEGNHREGTAKKISFKEWRKHCMVDAEGFILRYHSQQHRSDGNMIDKK